MAVPCTIVLQKNHDALAARNEDGSIKYRYIINSGSSRSSKTYSILQLFYSYAFANPNKRLAVFRYTKKDCKDTVLEDMKQAYPLMPRFDEVVLNLTDSIWKFPNGSTIRIEGTDDTIKVHGYHSDMLWFNEAYDIQDTTFNQLDMRCAGHVFIDLNPRKSHWSDDVAKRENAILIHSTFRDNPFCPPEQRAKILSYQPVNACELVKSGALQEMEARAYDLVGNPKGFTNRLLKELERCRINEDTNAAKPFEWDVYGLGIKADRPNRIFRFKEIPDDRYKALDVPRYYAVDWGAVDPWGILEFKYYDGALYFHELNYESENVIRERLTTTEREMINGSEEGIVTWMFKKLGVDPNREIICDNNRIEKIQALRSKGYAAYPAIKLPGSIIDGIDLLNNIPVYYTASSVNFAYEQENYSRKVDRYGVVEEEPEDTNNHLMDPARYGAFYLKRQGIIKGV